MNIEVGKKVPSFELENEKGQMISDKSLLFPICSTNPEARVRANKMNPSSFIKYIVSIKIFISQNS